MTQMIVKLKTSIYHLIEDSGMTKAQIADMLQVSERAIYHWLDFSSTKIPSTINLMSLLQILGQPIKSLL